MTPHPPSAQQTRRCRTDLMLALADSIEQRLAAAAITQSILARAFRGELVPTEAELAEANGGDYETAERLLARIREAATHTHASRPRRRRREVTA